MTLSQIEAQIFAEIDQRLAELRSQMRQLVTTSFRDAARSSIDGRIDDLSEDIADTTIGRSRNPTRIGGRILRDVGTRIGTQLSDAVFDNTQHDMRLGNHQFGSRVLEGLFKSQRNR
jgi:hypothetical protein